MQFRSEELNKKYFEYLSTHKDRSTCALCNETSTLKEYKHWIIVKNDFPYDLLATKHDMLVLKRHVPEKELNDEELKEFHKIKHELVDSEYEYIFEGTNKRKSIPEHYHIHLIITK